MTAQPTPHHQRLLRWACVAVLASVVTILIKGYAWWLTGSVGLLSDALESFVNLVGALIALCLLRISLRPADANHAFGHEKAEYFSSAIEGLLVIGGAVAIGWTAVDHLINPVELTQLGFGMIAAGVAALVNLGVGWCLLRVSREERSVTLGASGKHLLTDVWTTAGVIIAIALVSITGWTILDPLVAMVLAVHVGWTGVVMIRQSVGGLMDEALPKAERAAVDTVLAGFRARGIDFHAVRTRRAGTRRFVTMHVLVPGDWTVRRGHDLIEEVEEAVVVALPGASVFTHLEAIEDPASWDDVELR